MKRGTNRNRKTLPEQGQSIVPHSMSWLRPRDAQQREIQRNSTVKRGIRRSNQRRNKAPNLGPVRAQYTLKPGNNSACLQIQSPAKLNGVLRKPHKLANGVSTILLVFGVDSRDS